MRRDHDSTPQPGRKATQTPNREVILACQQTGRRVAIISNNSQAAVGTYLQLQDLAEHVDVVVGRTDPDPQLLKPHPHLVPRALDALGGDPAMSSFVGDSTSDVLSPRRPVPTASLRQQAGGSVA
jgi:phosphoglycolate phosphatase-like HAD superfamily hydrolase